MTLLDAQGIVRTYGARTVLGGVSLTLDLGDRVGLVGANGSGKSTLGRILAGVEEPDRGRVVLRRGARVGYLPQEPHFDGDPTAVEAVLGGLSAWSEAKAAHDEASAALERGDAPERWVELQSEAATRIEHLGGWDLTHQAEGMLARLGVTRPTQNLSTMSGGELRRVDLARLLVARPDLAILDEPTNHLDLDTIEWLEGHLASEQPGAVLLITHDRFFLDRLVRRTAELDRGNLRVFDGGYEAYLVAKTEREDHEVRAEQNRQNVLRRELDWLRRSAPARTSKQKARTQRATAVLAEEGPRSARDVALTVDTVRSGNTVLELEDLRIEMEGRVLVDGLTLALPPGERMGIVGPNGSGKTTLLRTLLGEHAPSGGTLKVGQNARITYLGQKREGLDESLTVLENVAGNQSRVTVGGRTMDARGYLERFLFDSDQQRQPVSVLSGGEKARALLAKLLLVPANLLILDEPTNDLDIATLSALEEMLVEMKGTALVVTHDRWFLDRVATSILAFEGDGRVVRYPGGYTSYRSLRSQRPSSRPSSQPPSQPSSRPSSQGAPAPSDANAGQSEPPKKRGGLTYGERIELSEIMERIAEAEDRVASLEARLADPALYEVGGGDAAGLAIELERARADLETRVTRWEALERKKGS